MQVCWAAETENLSHPKLLDSIPAWYLNFICMAERQVFLSGYKFNHDNTSIGMPKLYSRKSTGIPINQSALIQQKIAYSLEVSVEGRLGEGIGSNFDKKQLNDFKNLDSLKKVKEIHFLTL